MTAKGVTETQHETEQTSEGQELMTENNTAQVTPETYAAEVVEPETPNEETFPDITEQAETGNKEAAKYRRQLRDVEAARDSLSARLDTAHTAILSTELVKARTTVTPEALFGAGHTLDSLRDDDGNLDIDKIQAAAKDTIEKFGIPRPSARGLVEIDYESVNREIPQDSWGRAFQHRSRQQ